MTYTVFTRTGEYVFDPKTTSDYADANRIARITGGTVMFTDHFNATYKPVKTKRHYTGRYEFATK